MNSEFGKAITGKEIINGLLNVLVVAITPPLPQITGGAKAIAQTIIPLSNEFNYHLLLIGDGSTLNIVNNNINTYKKHFCTITVTKRQLVPKYTFGKLFYYFERNSNKLPFLQINFYSKQTIQTTRNIINKYKIDLFDLQTTHVAFIKKFFSQIPAVLVSQNIETDLFWMNEHYNDPRKTFNIAIEKYFAKRSNRNAINAELKNKFNIECMTFVTQNDSDRVEGCNNKYVLSLGYHFDKKIKKENHKTFNVIWLGGFDWYPNLQAMEWFVDNVYPILIKKYNCCINSINFQIVGRNPSAKILKLNSTNFQVLGFVENINSIISQADLSIAPIVSGGGIKTKVVECMVNKIPVVSTKSGVIGTGLQHNKSCYITNNPEKFADLIIEAYKNKNKIIEMAEVAYKIAQDHFDLNKFIDLKRSIYKKLSNCREI
mgnify:CR=1 FL=1